VKIASTSIGGLLFVTLGLIAAACAPTQRSSAAPTVTAASPPPGGSTSSPTGPVASCSVCSAGSCATIAGHNYCATAVDAANAAELEAHVGAVVSLRGAELGAAGGPCTLIGCDCCNECSGGSMLFRSTIGATFERAGRQVTLAIKPLKNGAALSCEAYRACDKPKCPLEPGKYDAVGTLRASDMGWDLELIALEPAAP
jgi:hypothetical protein